MPRMFVSSRDANHYQARADAHFQGSAGYWKQVYERRSLEALIYQHRQLAALALADALQLAPATPVLEVGCGAGFTAVALAQRGYVVEAIDTVPQMLDQTQILARKAGVGELVNTKCGDMHQLDYADKSFGLVVAIGVLPWLHSPRQALREVTRVLAPGGHFIASADNRWRLTRLLDPFSWARAAAAIAMRRLSLRSVPTWRTHSIRRIDADLESVGFQKLDGMTLGFGPVSVFGFQLLSGAAEIAIHKKLQNFADRGMPVFRSTGAHYLFLARKNAAGTEH